jgi:hypothetical protein
VGVAWDEATIHMIALTISYTIGVLGVWILIRFNANLIKSKFVKVATRLKMIKSKFVAKSVRLKKSKFANVIEQN